MHQLFYKRSVELNVTDENKTPLGRSDGLKARLHNYRKSKKEPSSAKVSFEAFVTQDKIDYTKEVGLKDCGRGILIKESDLYDKDGEFSFGDDVVKSLAKNCLLQTVDWGAKHGASAAFNKINLSDPTKPKFEFSLTKFNHKPVKVKNDVNFVLKLVQRT